MNSNHPILRAFWFPVAGHLGVGVTALDERDALSLARLAASRVGWVIDPDSFVPDIELSALDEEHVVPNMGSFIRRGAWYPNVGVV